MILVGIDDSSTKVVLLVKDTDTNTTIEVMLTPAMAKNLAEQISKSADTAQDFILEHDLFC